MVQAIQCGKRGSVLGRGSGQKWTRQIKDWDFGANSNLKEAVFSSAYKACKFYRAAKVEKVF